MQKFSSILHRVTRFSLSSEEAAQLKPLLAEVRDWPGLLQALELNALAPLFLVHARQHRLPADVTALKALTMRHRAAANARYRLCGELLRAFVESSIPVVALKGIALAPMIYAEDGLRPMRDIDLLVEPDQLQQAGRILRELGFDLPASEANRFMRDSHQLPNATRQMDGFTISVEIHHDALGRDVFDHLRYAQVANELQTIQWRDIELTTLGHEHMLHQVARHLAALHPGDTLKLINVLDVVGYAEKYQQQIDWVRLKRDFPHVLNTLQCLHLIVPLSNDLQARIGGISGAKPAGVGEIMVAMRQIVQSPNSLSGKMRLLFLPPDWWLHLYYNVSPAKSLHRVKLLRHPLTILGWLLKRSYAALFGH